MIPIAQVGLRHPLRRCRTRRLTRMHARRHLDAARAVEGRHVVARRSEAAMRLNQVRILRSFMPAVISPLRRLIGPSLLRLPAAPLPFKPKLRRLARDLKGVAASAEERGGLFQVSSVRDVICQVHNIHYRPRLVVVRCRAGAHREARARPGPSQRRFLRVPPVARCRFTASPHFARGSPRAAAMSGVQRSN